MLDTRISDILSRTPSLVIAKSTDTVSQVFSRLIDNGILSVPLLNTRTNRYTAFIDMFDILNFVMGNIDIEKSPYEVEEAVFRLFSNTPCTELVGKYASISHSAVSSLVQPTYV
jgi:CBS domain-containing protein